MHQLFVDNLINGNMRKRQLSTGGQIKIIQGFLIDPAFRFGKTRSHETGLTEWDIEG